MQRTTMATLAYATLLLACGGAGQGDLCRRTFEPYPDLISGRMMTGRDEQLVAGMERYAQGDHATAAGHLERYLTMPEFKKSAHLYLANSYLALGRPYDAELQLDHLENSTVKEHFVDQTEWYTVVCWLCSGQLDRALEGARTIADGRRHTYTKEARALVALLTAGKE